MNKTVIRVEQHETKMSGDESTLMIFMRASDAAALRIPEGYFGTVCRMEKMDLIVQCERGEIQLVNAHYLVGPALEMGKDLELVGVNGQGQPQWALAMVPES